MTETEAHPFPRPFELAAEVERSKKFLRQCARFARSTGQDLPFDLLAVVDRLNAARTPGEVEEIMRPVSDSMDPLILESLPD